MTMRPPIFIGNQERSGASLLRVFVGRHPNIFGGDSFETHWFSDEIMGNWQDPTTRRQVWLREWFGFSESEYSALQQQSTSGTNFFDRLMTFCAVREGRHRWLDKTPNNLYYYDLIQETWPGAKFIHALRDYKDVYASWKERLLDGRQIMSAYDFTKKVRQSYQQFDHLLGKRTTEYMETKYEELVHSPRDVVKAVVEFLDEPWIDGMEEYTGNSIEFYKVKQIIGHESRTSRNLMRPTFTSSVGRWKRDLTPEEIDVIDTELSDLRERLGYA